MIAPSPPRDRGSPRVAAVRPLPDTKSAHLLGSLPPPQKYQARQAAALLQFSTSSSIRKPCIRERGRSVTSDVSPPWRSVFSVVKTETNAVGSAEGTMARFARTVGRLARQQLTAAFCYATVAIYPPLSYRYYHWMADRGAYPPEADSIAIPIAGELIGWMLWAPCFCVALTILFLGHAPPYRFLAWDASRRSKSVAVTGLCLFFATSVVLNMPYAWSWGNYAEVAYGFWWAVFWLIVRSAWLSPRRV